jgi:predicted enzyme related to lactoylglutathione lyase
MVERESYEHGVPSWVDLGTPDLAAAERFYGGLFGWQVEQGPPEAGGYAMATLRGRNVAGLGPQQNPGPPVWATYVNVDDVDAVAAKVDEGGGKTLVPPMDVLDAGRMAIFTDPLGAAFGVWQPRSHTGAQLVNEPGAFCWSELLTTDVGLARDFYSGVFGWDSETHGDGPDAYTELKAGGRSIAGMMRKPDGVPAEMPPYWAVYFGVADVDEAVARVGTLGGSTLAEPRTIEAGRFAVVADPHGAAFGMGD